MGALFGPTLDPLIRPYLFTATRVSFRLCAFAGGIALAMARVTAQLPGIFSLSDLWAGASALTLNQARCVLNPAGDHEDARALLRTIPGCSDIKVQSCAKCLGVMVGHTAVDHQWTEVNARARARAGDVRLSKDTALPPVFLRLLYLTLVYLFKARFGDIPRPCLK